MSNSVEIVKALVSPCEILIKAVQTAIGKAYEPKHRKKMADAKAYEISTIGKAMRENIDIPIAYDKDNLSLNTLDFEAFVKRTQNRLAYQELNKQKNIEDVADQAYSLLEGNPPIENNPVDSDWLLRFFNSVQDISNTDMQHLWAKILAGEIISPGTVSLRTLAVLTQMTAKEAKLFEILLYYVLNCKNTPRTLPDDYFIFANPDILDMVNISFSEVLMLDEIGLITSNNLISVSIEVMPKSSEYIRHQGENVIEIKNNGDKPERIRRSAYILTAVGRELASIILHGHLSAEILSTYYRKCREIMLDTYFFEKNLSPMVEVSIVQNTD